MSIKYWLYKMICIAEGKKKIIIALFVGFIFLLPFQGDF